ncbi:exopolysaccharide biosynthesis polyprenyl glycosylphosphotransferase [Devosia sp. UYZn731]|uniref:exopolysaccharide biosynthesis polyprenyl glycosylphosphotransferase n=1 Tax=Devosia sp. UYZn731 TaxID=3156345 RepID=UPI003395DD97
MNQDSLHRWPVEARKRRRYRIPSRTYFGYAVGFVEGVLAILLVLIAARARPESPQSFALTVLVGGAYGVSCALASAQYLRSLATRRPMMLRSVLIWMVGVIVLVGAMLLSGGYALDGGWAMPVAAGLGLVAARLAFMGISSTLMHAGRLQIERVALVGRAADLAQFRQNVEVWRQGAQVVRSLTLDDTGVSQARTVEFARECVEYRCDTVLLVGTHGDARTFNALVAPFRSYALNVMLAPSQTNERQMLVDLLPVGATQPGRVLAKPIGDTGRLLKRAFDVVGAGFGLLLLSPLFLIVAVWIKFDSRGPVLFLQERRGFNGESFQIYKFRSMSVMEDGRSMTQAVPDDPRITAIGAVLRRTSIDELPQLMNVLLGNMSLVGPRPHAISHDAELALRFERYAQRQRIKPGITGWAQVNGFRGDTSTQEKIEGRTLHDLYYVEHWSLWFDIRILVLTFLSRKVRDNAL